MKCFKITAVITLVSLIACAKQQLSEDALQNNIDTFILVPCIGGQGQD